MTLIATIAACALLVSGVGVFIVTPTYTATSLILIEPQAPQILDMKQLMVEPATGVEHGYYKTQYALLRSRSLAAQVIHDLGLQRNPLLGSSKQPLGLVAGAWAEFRTGLDGLIGEQTDSGATGVSETYGVNSQLVDAYLDHLSVRPEFGTRLVNITFTTPSPRLSATLANAHAEAYLRQGMELRVKAAQAAQLFLEDKLVQLRERVEKSEAALNSYRHDKGILEFGTSDKNEILLKRLEDLNSALTHAETMRIELQSQADLIGKGDYDSLPGVVNSPMVQALRPQVATLEAQYASMSSRYTLAYRPLAALKAKLDDTRRLLRQSVTEIVRSVQLEYRASAAREKQLQREVAAEKAKALALNDASLKDAILARDVSTNRQLYETVLKRMKEMGVAAEVHASNVSLVDRAAPPSAPSGPRKMLIISLSGILALSLGITIAFLLEYLDDTFKTSEEVERYLRLPSLAFVPDVRKLQNGSYRVRLESRTSPTETANLPAQPDAQAMEKAGREGSRQKWALTLAREAYRTIRSQILLSRAGEPPKTVLITSAVPDEGKSITAVNTAITFAHKGRRVLLVDADLRRARCHELLKCDGRQGLSEVLTGQTALDQVVIPTCFSNLFLLSAGAVPPDPPELLGSTRMDEILSELGASYQHIIIDSAPVMPISDSIVLSKHIDGVVIVVDRSTSRQIVRRACLRVSDAGAKILGVVLNRASAYHASYYPYDSYNGYYSQSRPTGRNGSNPAEEHATIVFD